MSPEPNASDSISLAIIAALIAVAAIGAMQDIGTKLNNTFNNVGASLIAS